MHTRFSSRRASVLGLPIICALAAGPAFAQRPDSSSSPAVGAVISSASQSTYTRFLPPAAELGLKYGMTMRIVPTKRIDWSEGFTSATEKYSAQVGLDANDYITNYIAGMPFPTVSATDPKAAVKIAYNWHMGPFMPDDFSLEPWGSFAYSSTEPGSFVAEDWNAYDCSRMVFLRYAHRTEVDPRPTLGTNEDGIEWEVRCMEWRGGPDMSPWYGRVTGAVVRYLDPKKSDGEIWAGGRTRKYGGEHPVVLSWDRAAYPADRG